MRRATGARAGGIAAMAAAASISLSGVALAGSPVTVVELFTSQGCSSCPPANLNLGKLARRSDVLALSYGVTYWDYIGWKDIFAKPEYTDRQIAYERGLGHGGPFTPQMVVNGKADAVGNRLGEVESLIGKAELSGSPEVELANGHVAIGAADKPKGAADVWAVFFDRRTVDVAVGRGENSGRTLPHTNVVHHLQRIGAWEGAAVDIAVPRAPSGMSTAVLVQTKQGGPILAAVYRDNAAR